MDVVAPCGDGGLTTRCSSGWVRHGSAGPPRCGPTCATRRSATTPPPKSFCSSNDAPHQA